MSANDQVFLSLIKYHPPVPAPEPKKRKPVSDLLYCLFVTMLVLAIGTVLFVLIATAPPMALPIAFVWWALMTKDN